MWRPCALSITFVATSPTNPYIRSACQSKRSTPNLAMTFTNTCHPKPAAHMVPPTPRPKEAMDPPNSSSRCVQWAVGLPAASISRNCWERWTLGFHSERSGLQSRQLQCLLDCVTVSQHTHGEVTCNKDQGPHLSSACPKFGKGFACAQHFQVELIQARHRRVGRVYTAHVPLGFLCLNDRKRNDIKLCKKKHSIAVVLWARPPVLQPALS